MRSKWKLRAARALVIGSVLAVLPVAVAGPASAAYSDCTARSLSNPFTPWGDENDYFLVPNGTFESRPDQWVLGGTYRAWENEWWYVAGWGQRSLVLPAGSWAQTPTMCLANDENAARFFYKSPGDWASWLQVNVEVSSSKWGSYSYDVWIEANSEGWQVSPPIPVEDWTGDDLKQNVKITFIPYGDGQWQIDDVFVDPFKTR